MTYSHIDTFGNLRKIAGVGLFILPLILTATGHAGTILPAGGNGCATFDNSSHTPVGFCSQTSTQLADSNGVQGINFSLTATATDSASNGGFDLSSGGTMSGALNSVVIPWDYSFTISGNPASWSVGVGIHDSTTNQNAVTSVSGAGNGSFLGTGSLTIGSGFSGSSDSISVTAFINYMASGTVTLSSFSSDVNSAPSSPSAPEPGSLVLVAGGLLLLGWFGINRKSSRA